MIRFAILLLILIVVSLEVSGQAKDEVVSLSSWCKGLGQIVETKMTVIVSRDKPTFVSELKTVSGKALELQLNYRPMEFLERDHWIVQMFEKLKSPDIENVRADLFNVEKPGTGGDRIRGDGRIRYLYPEDKRSIRFNKDKLITEGRVLFFDPLKRLRVFKFEDFEVRVAVRTVKLAHDDPNRVVSMEIEIETLNYRS